MAGIWQELGIERTTDAQAIRRAYARRLKTVDQRGDPAAFERLRQAYEQALAGIAGPAGARPLPLPPPRPAAAEPRPAPAAPPGEAVPAGTAAVPSPHPPAGRLAAGGHTLDLLRPLIEAAFAARDTREVARLMQSSEAQLQLSLADVDGMLPRLAALLADDDCIRGDEFLALAGRFGLDAATFPRGPLRQRLAAEDWWSRLDRLADERPRDKQRGAVLAARLLLGRAPRHTACLNDLAAALAGLIPDDGHPASGLLGRLDPGRLAWCRAIAAGRDRPVRLARIGRLYLLPVLIGAAFAVSLDGNDPLRIVACLALGIVYYLARIGLPRLWFYVSVLGLMLALASAPSLRREIASRLWGQDAPVPAATLPRLPVP